MIDTNAMLLCDSYKTCHINMFPKGLTKLYSYWTPRKSMLKTQNKMVFFGLQAFIQEFLVDYFKKNFFDREINDVVSEYEKYMKVQLPNGGYATTNIIDLHRLGYLPLQIRAIPEGTSVNMGIPCIEVTNTNDNFAWLVQLNVSFKLNFGRLAITQRFPRCTLNWQRNSMARHAMQMQTLVWQ